LYENGNYDPAYNGEAWLLQCLAKLAPTIIFDVGANRGEYAELALAACSQANIYAFEPMPSVFKQLKEALGSETRINLNQLALSDQAGDIRFWFDQSNTGNTTALADVQSLIHKIDSPSEVIASAQRLDTFCKERMINHIDLLKIDVEGFEANVLQGGAYMVSNGSIACIQIEYGKANLFSRYFIHDLMRDYQKQYAIGKLYPRGVHWFQTYSVEYDDLLGPNLVMVWRQHSDLINLLTHPGSAPAT
jgi:FkbM family methyltransferase